MYYEIVGHKKIYRKVQAFVYLLKWTVTAFVFKTLYNITVFKKIFHNNFQ